MRKDKGREAKLVFMGHALMENGNGLQMDFYEGRVLMDNLQGLVVDVKITVGTDRGFRLGRGHDRLPSLAVHQGIGCWCRCALHTLDDVHRHR